MVCWEVPYLGAWGGSWGLRDPSQLRKRSAPACLLQAFKVLNSVRARQAINNLQVWPGEGVCLEMAAATCSVLHVIATLFPATHYSEASYHGSAHAPLPPQARLKYLLGVLVIAHVVCFVVSFMLINSSLSYISQIDYAGGWPAWGVTLQRAPRG